MPINLFCFPRLVRLGIKCDLLQLLWSGEGHEPYLFGRNAITVSFRNNSFNKTNVSKI